MQVKIHSSISEVSAQQWNAVYETAYPFIKHEFLSALESTGCVAASTGWQPVHITLQDNSSNVLAAMPLYLKMHSRGEYVFDHSWADAYARQGLSYYPKLVSAIPFSPVRGPRIGTGSLELETCGGLMVDAITQLMEKFDVSSWHALFMNEEQTELLPSRFSTSLRTDVQYHWFNYDYDSFDHFLERCTSRKRKNLRKERQQVKEQGISFRRLSGNAIKQVDWQCFYGFYEATYFKRGMRPYLKQNFFESLVYTMPSSLVLIEAHKDNSPVAMALCFQDENTLYGRYWGCMEEFHLLHFETCYYQGIEYAIENGLDRFDPGTQGEHKISRGFEPVEMRSVHHLRHQGFASAVEDFCKQERTHILEYISQAKKRLPFKKELL